MSDNMIKAIGINKYFGKAQVLKDISLSAARGDIYGLIGKNGAGKTTFMRILAGLMKPSSGSTETTGRVSFYCLPCGYAAGLHIGVHRTG